MKKWFKFKIEVDNGIIVGLVLSLFLIWGGFYLSHPNFFELQKEAEQIVEQKMAEQKEINKIKAFDHLTLIAKAFVVYDLETGELIAGRREQEILSLASITKIMTVLVASDNLDSEKIISINQVTGANGGLVSGEEWSLDKLVALTLVSSSNDGAVALAGNSQADFVNKMNEKALALNLPDLHFTNPTGLDDQSIPGGVGSALSVAKLFSHIIKTKPELLLATRESIVQEKSLDNLNHTVLNTNEIINDIPGLLASKTGYTNLAGGNLAIVANVGLSRPVAIVVLGSSRDGRFSDVKKLVEATIDYYSKLSSL